MFVSAKKSRKRVIPKASHTAVNAEIVGVDFLFIHCVNVCWDNPLS
ncbi:MAG: hypothetical protein L6V85_02455 [Clostridiales bacterium]|nr:MAG: hypothetical protein L6V85_02455 [Clostridiales bacterium]